jgi:hypothetical protein
MPRARFQRVSCRAWWRCYHTLLVSSCCMEPAHFG